MSTIQRYQYNHLLEEMRERPNGEYVLFSDHEAEVERLRKVLQEICDNNRTAEDAGDALLDTQEILKELGIEPTSSIPDKA